MYLLYCDETNFEKKAGGFFVYGGIVIDANKAKSLSHEITALRNKFGVPYVFPLKFNPGPEGLDHATFVELKKGIIQLSAAHGCKLLVNLTLHDIASSSEVARRNGINTACYHFDCFLNRSKVGGLVFIDRFTDKEIDEQLKQKLSIGLTGKLPYSGSMKLEHILGYHMTGIGQSHFCSVVDIILGSLRFSINAFTQKQEKHMNTAGDILAQLAPMFYREGGSMKAHEISLWFSPKIVKVKMYRDRYVALKQFFASRGIEAAQPILLAEQE